MAYLLNFLAVPLYYFVLRLMTTKREADRLFMWIVAVHAILFRALANPYNYVDTDNYVRAFKAIVGWGLKETVIDTNEFTSWGRGYLMYNWLLGRLTNDPQVLYIVTSFIAVGVLMIYYKKTIYTVLTPILFYLSYHMMYIHGFGVIRQHMAIPLLLFALYYIEKTKVSIGLAFVATLLHTGCVVFFPFYLVYWLSGKLTYGEVAIFSVSFFAIGRIFIAAMLTFFPRFEAYLHSTSSNNTVPVLLTVFMVLLLYEANVFRQVRKKEDRNMLLFLLYGLGLTVFCVGLPGAGRLSLPIVYAVPVAMSLLYRYGGKSKDEYKLCVVGLTILVALSLFLAEESGRTPLHRYSFFWEDVSR